MYWKAIELDPAFSRAYAGLAMTYALAYQLGWEDEAALSRAIEFAGTATQMSPDMPEAHWVLGFVETQGRRYADAIRHLQRALRLNPSYADAYALMGGIRTYTGQPAESVSLLRTALRLNPDAGSLYFLLLGRAYYFLDDYEQARVNLEQALARNADNVEARVYLAAVLGQLGDREGAAWQADEIRVIEPTFSVSRWLSTYPMTDKRQEARLAQALLPSDCSRCRRRLTRLAERPDFRSRQQVPLAVPNAQAHHFLVVFGFVGLGYLAAIVGVHAAPAPAARVARILARTHLGMAAAESGDLLLKLDRRDRPILSTTDGTNENGTGRNRSGVELVGDGRPIHRGYGAQAHHHHQRLQSGSHRFLPPSSEPTTRGQS